MREDQERSAGSEKITIFSPSRCCGKAKVTRNMGLFEYFFERYNPGPIGTVEWDDEPDPVKPEKKAVYARLGITLVILAGIEYLAIGKSGWDISGFLLFNLFFVVYLLIAYKLTVRPDMSNLGGWGPFLDHPFRISDDWNRRQLLLKLLLIPGRFLSDSMVAFYRHQFKRRKL